MNAFSATAVNNGTNKLSSKGNTSTSVAIIALIIAAGIGKKRLMQMSATMKNAMLPSKVFFLKTLCFPNCIPISAAAASANICTLKAASIIVWLLLNKAIIISAAAKKYIAAFPGNFFSSSLSTCKTIFWINGILVLLIIRTEIITPNINDRVINFMLISVPKKIISKSIIIPKTK